MRLYQRSAAWPTENLDLFRRLLKNVVDSPGEAKFRRLKVANPRIGALLAAPGVRQALGTLGWTAAGEGGEEALEFPPTADLAPLAAVLEKTAPRPEAPGAAAETGEPWVVTVMRGPLRHRLELPPSAPLSSLVAAIEKSSALGCMPRGRQLLLAGYPPKPIRERGDDGEVTRLAKLGVKTVMLEDLWEQVVGDLRAGRASFAQLAEVFTRPSLAALALRDNRDFIVERSRAMLKSRIASIAPDELQAARHIFQIIWPPGEAATQGERMAFCSASAVSTLQSNAPSTVTVLGVEMVQEAEEPETRFVMTVDRKDVFRSGVSQVVSASPVELHRPLEVRFANEAAEDAGGLRREFFNEFGRAAANAEGLWQLTAAGALVPVPAEAAARQLPEAEKRQAIYRGCGRIFGMALVQAARGPIPQPLLLGLPLARNFVRAVQGSAIESLDELQAELNNEQHTNAPDFRGSAAFRERSLAELGLEGQLSFSCPVPGGGVVDLVAGGRDLPVTNETKNEWLELTLRYELVGSVAEAALAFRAGVCDLVGAAHLVLLSAEELREAWSGRGVVTDEDLQAWKAATDVSPAVGKQAEWLFELLHGELRDARGQVLKFTTGSDRWPVDSRGFKFVIEPRDGGDEALPSAMTCGNMLQLPRYTAREPLRDRLMQALNSGMDLHLT